MRGERGAVLAQVLMLAVVASLLCASILRARLQPALTTSRVVARVSDDLAAQGAVNRITEVWVRRGTCQTDATNGVYCNRPVSAGPCDCTCAVDPFSGKTPVVTVVSTPFGRACSLAATPR